MVRDGYKITEVGVIPLDWEVKLLPEVIDFMHGKAHEGCISERGKFIVVNSKFISSDGQVSKKSLSNFQPAQKGDILTVLSDLPNGKALAKCFLVEEDNIYAVNQRICLYRSKGDDYRYLKYILNRNVYFLKLDDGVTQTNIKNSQIERCLIPLPPTQAEQSAIATALSDTDALLSALDALIGKKEAFKRGMMAGLLSGALNWEKCELRENVKVITKGTTPTSYGRQYQSSGVTFVKVESINDDFNIMTSKVAYIDDETNNLLSRSKLEKDDILISIAGALGRVGIVRADILPANTNQALAIVRLDDSSKVFGDYLKYYLTSPDIKTQIEGMGSQGAQPNLSLENIADLIIRFPSLPEQRAIARVLSDLDAELSALRARRAKLGLVKGGMMGELLSGGVRLV